MTNMYTVKITRDDKIDDSLDKDEMLYVKSGKEMVKKYAELIATFLNIAKPIKEVVNQEEKSINKMADKYGIEIEFTKNGSEKTVETQSKN